MSTPIERLRALHKPCAMPCFDHAWVGDRQHCAGPHCLATWPCDTIAALEALEKERDSTIVEPITVAHLEELRNTFDRPRRNLGDYPSGRFSDHEVGGLLSLAEKQAAELDLAREAYGMAMDAEREMEACLAAATVLIRQAMRERHYSIRPNTGDSGTRCGSPIGTSIDTCENCRPYREWLEGEGQ